MKTLKTLLVTIAVLLCSTTVSAHDFEADGIYYNITSSEDLTVEVTYKGSTINSAAYSGDVVIPANVVYNGSSYDVTSIGVFAFGNCTSLINISIPNSVTSIGRSAFEGCTGLNSIDIPISVISIESDAFKNSDLPVENNVRYADTWAVELNNEQQTSYTLRSNTTGFADQLFQNCLNMTSIELPNTLKHLGNSTFYGCYNLTEISIPGSVTSIGSYAFYNCTSLTNITIPNSVKVLEYYVFKDCTGLTSITISNSVKSIESYAFEGCIGLTSITIPNSVTSIGYEAFKGCIGLADITIPSSVTTLGDGGLTKIFPECTNLVTVTIESQSVALMKCMSDYFGGQVTKYIIGEEVTSIGDYAFSGCASLTNIIIPNSVTSIGRYTFSNCTGLTDITIPNSVTSIGNKAFSGCIGLTDITIPSSVTTLGDNIFPNCTNLVTVTIESQNVASMSVLKSVFGEQVTTYILGNSVTSIGYQAFNCCTELTEITIPNSVTSIGDEAFYGCSSLTDITIPNSVTSIGSSAFSDCTGLTNITIPNSVTSIEYSSFYGCSNLTDITIPNSVTSIGNYAFGGCTSLPVENNIRYADTWAVGVTDNTLVRYTLRENTRGLAATFSGCTSLVRITLPENLIYVSDYAFSGCSSLKSLTLPDGVSTIGSHAFYNCTNLSDINIPSGVTDIGEYAFYECALTEVSIPKGITEIMSSSFHGNDFSAIEIPEGVTSIGYEAFSFCNNLDSVSLPQSLTSIANYAFGNCFLLSSIIIPKSVTSIGSYAFSDLKSVTLNSPTIFAEGGFADKFGSNVTEYIINADVEEVKDYAFYNSTVLQSITLPETLTTIGEGAFEECVSLDSITIPANVTEIKDYAFSNCTALKYIACEALVPPTCGTDAFADVNMAECTLEVPDTVASIYATTAPWSSFNIKAVETPKEEIITRVDLVDGNLFENAEEVLMDTITYTRTLSNLKWNALYVPFEIPMDSLIENYDIAYINAMHSYDMDDNGAIDSMVMEVVKIKEGTLHANYPYLIRAKNEEAKAMKIVVENSTLYAAESVTVDCSSVFTKFEITGTYQPLTNEEIAGCYVLSGGTWKTMKDDATLNPFRLYLRISDREGSPVKVDTYALEQTSVTIRVQGENPGTTSIESEEIRVKNEESDAIIYNLMGQPVKNPVKGSIYIQGGRKVVW